MTFEEIKHTLKYKIVGIAGAGGLGSNCAVALARSGIGKLIIADFDVVSESNLNRQYYFYNQIGQIKVYALKDNLECINPDVKVNIHNIKIDKDNFNCIFSECDIIVEAFDKAEEKEMLIETILTKFPDKPIISGLGMAGYGNNDSLHSRKIDNLYICGDEKTEISEDNPPLAPRVGIVANMQANIVLDILLNE
ncbi:MAG: sulfur carrier protein ThiS adenylyltransferase ThiF [Bacteroidales bacterium]|nr:sulfur carrier protein ThiS adenylyltransferase ThiF [Bacteroidales bacterium]